MATPDQLQKLAQQSTYMTEKSSASVLEDGFDRDRLARELATSIKLEATRQKIDDTKKRAITTARDYNEFKNMVLMADQTPVSTKEMQNFGSQVTKASQHHGREETNNSQVFSRISGAGKPESRGRTSRSAKRREGKRAALKAQQKSAAEILAAAALGGKGLEEKGPVAPKSHVNFARDWERHCKNDHQRIAYLMQFGSQQTIAKIFKPCLDFMLLGTLLSLFEKRLGQCNVHAAYGAATKRSIGASEAGSAADANLEEEVKVEPSPTSKGTSTNTLDGECLENNSAGSELSTDSSDVRKIGDFLVAFSTLDTFPGTLKLMGNNACQLGARLAKTVAARLGQDEISTEVQAVAKLFEDCITGPNLPKAADEEGAGRDSNDESEHAADSDDDESEESDDSSSSDSD
eukprot:INCI479.1.p1 GENE.INCI479.1~~INCI479.1.p1  ORF type:complete len:405 (-),score=96.25 INCI479.1:1395-2609(-)